MEKNIQIIQCSSMTKIKIKLMSNNSHATYKNNIANYHMLAPESIRLFLFNILISHFSKIKI